MKKIKHTVAIIIAFFFANMSFATKVHSSSSGSINNSSNWVSNPPKNYDTVYIDHAMTFSSSSSSDWSSSTVNVVIITSSGSLTPSGSSADFKLPSGTKIIIQTGGKLYNNSGNNSNHRIRIGSTCVWGKSCCSSNRTINGPVFITSSTACSYTALPVVMISFKGERFTNGEALITWVTSSEEQNKKFIIEYSNDGQIFAPIGEVASAANTGNSQSLLTYQFLDKRIVKEDQGFYRITQIDIDGSIGFTSNIIVVKNSIDINTIPVKIAQSTSGEKFSVTINPVDLEAIYTIEVFTAFGQKVFSGGEPVSGFQNVALPDLTKGMYIVKINFTDLNNVVSQKILVL